MKADQLRSKASVHPSGTSRGAEAVEKARKAATSLLELKYPERARSDVSIKLTTQLEVKYFNFNNPEMIVKSRDLTKTEVFLSDQNEEQSQIILVRLPTSVFA